MKSNRRLNNKLFMGCAFLPLVSSMALSAERTIEEVVVTAQKREERLQDIPISIGAITSAEIENKGLVNFKDIALATPSISTAPAYGTPGALLFYMRGMGTSDPENIRSEGGVGIYEDGFYVARSHALTLDVADIERVEVLRGPQGTLYGFNTAGGAINLISKKPSGVFNIKQTLDFGTRDLFRSMTVIDLPEWKSVASKLTLLTSSTDGYVKNAGPSHDYGENEQIGGKLQLRWNIGSVTADYFLDIGEQKATPQQYFQNPAWEGQVITLFDPVTLQPITSNLYDHSSRPRRDTYRPIDLDLSTSRLEAHGLTFSWDVNRSVTFKSLTGYRHSTSERKNDFAEAFATSISFIDPTLPPVPTLLVDFGDRHSDQFSQEFQMVGSTRDEKIDYVAGVYYFRERGSATDGNEGQVPALVPILATDASFTTIGRTSVESKSKAVYGQVTFRPDLFSQRLELTLGGRYTRDDREGEGVNVLGVHSFGDDDFSRFTPMGTVNFRWTDDLSTYFKVATGYRAGGVCLLGSQCFTPGFDPEIITSYEFGLKSYWLDRSVRLNFAVFENEFDDMQLNFSNGRFGASTIQGTFNAGESTIQGLEADILVQPTDDLSLTLSYSYIDAKIDKIDVPESSTFDAAVNPTSPYRVGDNAKDAFVVPFAPEHSVDFAIDYTFVRFERGDLAAHLDYRFQSEAYQLPTYGPDVVGHQFGRSSSYGVFNGRLTFTTDLERGDRISLSLWGKNIFNKQYVVSSIGNGDNLAGFTSAAEAWAPPPSYGVSLVYDYNAN